MTPGGAIAGHITNRIHCIHADCGTTNEIRPKGEQIAYESRLSVKLFLAEVQSAKMTR